MGRVAEILAWEPASYEPGMSLIVITIMKIDIRAAFVALEKANMACFQAEVLIDENVK